LAAAIGLTFFIVYLPRPRVWSYKLSGTTLTAVRAHRRGRADEKTIDLRDCHSIDVHPQEPGRRVRPQLTLTLWPKRRFASDVDVYGPKNLSDVEQAFRDSVG
jgi:hypothetical protein